MPDQQCGTVVIGGSQAGLAVGYHLRQRGLPFVILDENDRIGDVWRTRWDSLRLFTPARYNGLPGMPFPGSPSVYPTKDETADYLETYAREFALRSKPEVRSRQTVQGRGSIRGALWSAHALRRERGRGYRRLSHPQDPAVRTRARREHRPALLQGVPQPFPNSSRGRAGGWRRQLRRGDSHPSNSLPTTGRGYQAGTRGRSPHGPGVFPISCSRPSCGSWPRGC